MFFRPQNGVRKACQKLAPSARSSPVDPKRALYLSYSPTGCCHGRSKVIHLIHVCLKSTLVLLHLLSGWILLLSGFLRFTFCQVLGWSSCLRSPTNRHAVVRLGRIVSPDSLCHLWFYNSCATDGRAIDRLCPQILGL